VEQYAGEGGNIIGVGQTVKQIHERRPSQVTPIKGLYIVGAEAGGHGIGTELAANSAMELSEILARVMIDNV
jgi:phytoene dehydrogenase-like protein